MPFLIFIAVIFPAAHSFAETPRCAPFKINGAIPEPPVPDIQAPDPLPPAWEKTLTEKISLVPTQEKFSGLYQKWLAQNPDDMGARDRYLWLRCLDYYLGFKNSDGAPAYTALIDRRPSRVLYPTEPKWTNARAIPAEIKFDPVMRTQAAAYQRQLFDEFGILAADYSDKHSPYVLKELLFLLRKGFAGYKFKTFRYLYAFAGHDPLFNTAAYHREADAISVGGIKHYGHPLNPRERVNLLESLAHEIGHAFIFDDMSPTELLGTARDFGKWEVQGSAQSGDTFDFYSPVFFRHRAQAKSDTTLLRKLNMVSQYSFENIHEWFAEAFAAATLVRMGTNRDLGRHWRDLLVFTPKHATHYWSNYNEVSNSFIHWLDKKTAHLLSSGNKWGTIRRRGDGIGEGRG